RIKLSEQKHSEKTNHTKRGQPIPTKKQTQKQKTGIKTNTLSSSQTTPTHSPKALNFRWLPQ
ncbi:MAG: hypothetical protein E7L06_06265, partial [Schaalia turicensis]|nr:hypothetical protein [Schaalia turicensis]